MAPSLQAMVVGSDCKAAARQAALHVAMRVLPDKAVISARSQDMWSTSPPVRGILVDIYGAAWHPAWPAMRLCHRMRAQGPAQTRPAVSAPVLEPGAMWPMMWESARGAI